MEQSCRKRGWTEAYCTESNHSKSTMSKVNGVSEAPKSPKYTSFERGKLLLVDANEGLHDEFCVSVGDSGDSGQAHLFSIEVSGAVA